MATRFSWRLPLEPLLSHWCALPNLSASVWVTLPDCQAPPPAALPCGLDDSRRELLAQCPENKPRPGNEDMCGISVLLKGTLVLHVGPGVCPPHVWGYFWPHVTTGAGFAGGQRHLPLLAGEGRRHWLITKGQCDCCCQPLSSLCVHIILNLLGIWSRLMQNILDLWVRLGFSLLFCTLDSFFKEIRDKTIFVCQLTATRLSSLQKVGGVFLRWLGLRWADSCWCTVLWRSVYLKPLPHVHL